MTAKWTELDCTICGIVYAHTVVVVVAIAASHSKVSNFIRGKKGNR